MTEMLFIPVGPELLVIGLLVVLLFGASKVPELARAVGQSFGEFRKGKEESEEGKVDFDPMEEKENEVEETTESTETEQTTN